LRDSAENGDLEMVEFICTNFPVTAEDTFFSVEVETLMEDYSWTYCLVEKCIVAGKMDVARYVCRKVGLPRAAYGRVMQALVDTDHLDSVADFLPVALRFSE
jgi:hypothetical protein